MRDARRNDQPSVLFLNRFYWPDVAATGQMLTDLAEDLAGMGWRVTVVTGAGEYGGGEGRIVSEEWRNGVLILRSSGTNFGRHRTIGRISDYLSYLTGTAWRLLRLERHDHVVAMSDPPFVGLLAILAARLKRSRSVYWVQDLFPEIAARLGVMRERGLAYRIARRAAHWMHRRFDLVIALGPRMEQALVQAGAPSGRTRHVHNWADGSAIVPILPGENPFVSEHGLDGRFVVLYSGNAGRAHRFEAVMEAARRLRDQDDILFLFIGGGKRWPELREAARRDDLGNVRFMDYVDRDRLPLSLTAASVSLVTEDPDVEGLLVPSKAYGILASGRPLLFVGSEGSDVALIVRTVDCGLVISPEDSGTLVSTILALRGDPAECTRLGRNARLAAERLYDRRHSTRQWAALVSGQP